MHDTTTDKSTIRRPPARLHGGCIGLLRFMHRNRMFTGRHLRHIARWAWLKLRWRGRLQTDGLCFVSPGVRFEIGRHATIKLGRWSWVGKGCKFRAHEGQIEIGAKTVLGEDCTLTAYQHITIGRECILADRVMLIDFDHNIDDVERPIRTQGIGKADVDVGHNVWIGHGVSVLRGVTVGTNSVVGANSVVTRDLPDNSISAGSPARMLKERSQPMRMEWG